MAYVEKYKAGWSSPTQDGFLYIDQLDYSGGITDIVLKYDGLRINRQIGDWESHVLGMSLEITLVNDKVDWFDLFPLMTAEEREYRVRVELNDDDSTVLFQGFLNCESSSQKYLHRQSITLTASSYLSKTKDLNAPSIDTLQKLSFIDIIDEILTSFGANYNIRVNATLEETSDPLGANQTLFNKYGFFTELFWENNVDRKSGYDILNSVLTTFDCYLYWEEGYWYIEAYEDIWPLDLASVASIDFIEYTTGVSYGISDTGTPVQKSRTVEDIQDLVFMETSQTVHMTPGLKKLIIELQDAELFNLTLNDLTDATDFSGGVPYPGLRMWQKWDEVPVVWSKAGQVWKNIENSILRTGWFGSYDVHRGLYTRFDMSVSEDTVLKVSFKFAAYYSVHWEEDNYDVQFHWYLRDAPGNYFIVYNDSSEEWERVSATEATALQEIVVPISSFDEDNRSVEISFSVPLGEITAYSGDKNLVLCIGTELMQRDGFAEVPALNAYYGDINLTVQENKEDNVIEAEVNTNFLNKKTIKLDLFDINSFNYKNGVLYGTDFYNRSAEWSNGDSNTFDLVEHLIRNKFQFYSISRQTLKGSVKSGSILSMFQTFEDSEQSGKYFVLIAYAYSPISDTFECVLYEYDNITEINLI